MNENNDPFRKPPPTTTNRDPYRAVVYRSSAAVYRGLELPISPPVQQLDTKRQGEKAMPFLSGPAVNKHGEAMYVGAGEKLRVADQEAKPLPIPLLIANAPHNALTIRSQPVSLVVEEVHKLFARHLVDQDYSDFVWDCKCYANHTETRFVARLFSAPDRTDFFLLDFQRLCGDAFHFQSIHRAINSELLKSGFVICKEECTAPTLRVFKPMPLPSNFLDEELTEEKASDYDPIVKMVSSDFIDVQREGLIVLSNQLEQNPAARLCLTLISDKLFTLACVSHDQQVRRLAVSALRWLAESTRIACSREQAAAMCKLVFHDKEISETRRQAGILLRNLAESNQEMVKDILKSFSSAKIIAKDARLIQIIDDLQKI